MLLLTCLRSAETPFDATTCSFGKDRQELWHCVQNLGPRSVPLLLQKVRDESSVRSDIVSALASLGPDAVPDLVNGFRDRNVRIRLTAIRAFISLHGDLESQAALATPGLVKLMNDPNREIRYSAVLACRRMGPSRVKAVPALIQALRVDDTDSTGEWTCTRMMALQILGKIGPGAAAAVPALDRILNEPDSDLGEEALVALWRITRDPKQIGPELSRWLSEPSPAARHAAMVAVRRIGRETKLDPGLLAEAAAFQDDYAAGPMQAMAFGTEDL